MRLGDERLARYFDDGFPIVEDMFTGEELQPVLDDFAAMADGWADRLYAAGKIADEHAAEDVYTRPVPLEKERPNAAKKDFMKYKKMEDVGFDFSPPGAPWRVRWIKYRRAAAQAWPAPGSTA